MTPGPLSLLAGAGLFAWLYLAFVRHGFWRGNQRLKMDARAPGTWPRVVAIIPARNEAEYIGRSISSVVGQDYPGTLRVILVDDSSEDGTAAIARNVKGDILVEVVAAPPLQVGWTGKLWALAHGMRHAAATGRMADDTFLWFTDADIVHGPDTLRALVAKAVNEKRDMVSLMAKLNCTGASERWLVPAFVFFFQKLYPFPDVNRDASPTAAAAGGCILLRHGMLKKAGGLAAIRSELIDDCSLARRVRDAGGRLWLGLADNSWSIRAYNFRELWQMVARTAFTQLNHSALLLLGTVLAMGAIYLAPPLLVLLLPLHGDALAAAAGLAAWIVMAVLYWPTLTYYRRSPIEGFMLPVISGLYTLATIHSAVDHWLGRGSRWKARFYSSNGCHSVTQRKEPWRAYSSHSSTR